MDLRWIRGGESTLLIRNTNRNSVSNWIRNLRKEFTVATRNAEKHSTEPLSMAVFWVRGSRTGRDWPEQLFRLSMTADWQSE